MKPYYSDSHVTIYCGDCREVLPSVHADLLLTDPPYGIGPRKFTGQHNPDALLPFAAPDDLIHRKRIAA